MKQIAIDAAKALTGYGYRVYMSADNNHGFYTDGKRVVSFGGQWAWCLDFSGNYACTRTGGTGWQIKREAGVPTEEQAKQYVTSNAPAWANPNPVYTTPEQHLATYCKSSGYTVFSEKAEQ